MDTFLCDIEFMQNFTPVFVSNLNPVRITQDDDRPEMCALSVRNRVRERHIHLGETKCRFDWK